MRSGCVPLRARRTRRSRARPATRMSRSSPHRSHTWRVLPPDMRERLLRGLLGSDVVAFHTKRYARNFVTCCEELLGLEVDREQLSIRVDGRQVLARHYPISVDPKALDGLLESDE